MFPGYGTELAYVNWSQRAGCKQCENANGTTALSSVDRFRIWVSNSE